MKRQIARLVASCLILHLSWPSVPRAQTNQAATAPQAEQTQAFNTEQLDALLAPIALYPDELLTQILMASTFPLEVVQAARWLEQPGNKDLKGDALQKALEPLPWDPSVKSLVPFPEVLALMNSNLDWTQQLGYAFADQQAAVFDSVQRLRRQAKGTGNLQSSPQQVVHQDGETIIIQPAQPNVVYVPNYNPTTVYGTWPYPSYPPVNLPPPPGYYFGTALATGMAFAAGAAIVGGLWGWARPAWGGGYANVNVNRYNNINVNRQRISSNVWQPNRAGGRPAGLTRPPRGPVGTPARLNGLPAGAIGRNQVSVPRSAVSLPARQGGGAGTRTARTGTVGQGGGAANRAGLGQGTAANRPNRPQGGNAGNLGNRPSQPIAGNRAGNSVAANRPNRPSATNRAATQRSPGAFSGMSDGRQASQFAQRGAQSRSMGQRQRQGGGARATAARGGGPRRRG
jgi:hypothetical protein